MQTGWFDVLQRSHNERPLVLRPGCAPSDIERAEASLGVTIPQALSDFLKASDGFTDVRAQYAYAWDLATIVSENRRAWSDTAMHLDRDLLAFGGDGAGDWFCLSLTAPSEEIVFHWGWIDRSPRPVAKGLLTFWRTWLDRSLSV